LKEFLPAGNSEMGSDFQSKKFQGHFLSVKSSLQLQIIAGN